MGKSALYLLVAYLACAPVAWSQDIPVDEAFRADRDAVRQLQTQLNSLGFDAGAPDGAFGRRTRPCLSVYPLAAAGSPGPSSSLHAPMAPARCRRRATTSPLA